MDKNDFRPALGQALNEVSGSIAKIPDLLKEVMYILDYASDIIIPCVIINRIFLFLVSLSDI